MKWNFGYSEFDIEKAQQVLSWSLLIDYDPHSHLLEDAIGDHYTIYKFNGQYFFHHRQRLQEHFAGEVADGPEYLTPIMDEIVCIYAIPHNREDIIKQEGLQICRKYTLKKVLSFAYGDEPQYVKSKKELFVDFNRLAAQISEKKLPFAEDIKYDLKELERCLDVSAYRAALVISGRILELCLKLFCLTNNIDFSDKMMIGQLIGQINQSEYYLDPSIKNVWDIINQQRIIGVHVKAQAPIPSREQTFMVCFAVIDVLKRLLEG